MKIAFIVPELSGRGGIDRVVSLLAEYFDSCGDEVVLVFLGKRFGYQCYGNIIEFSVKQRKSKIGKLLTDIQQAGCLFSFFRKKKFDAIYNLYWLAHVVLFFQRDRIFSSIHLNPHHVSLVFKILIKLFFPIAKKVIVPSCAIAKIFEQDFGFKNIVSIYNPINFKELDVLTNVEFPIELPSDFIISAGRLAPEKNYNLLIRAFAQSKCKNFVSLIIIGEGVERVLLEKLIYELDLQGKVLLLGMISNPFVYMRRSLFFVLTSKTEVLPMALIEALACGVPVVSTNYVGVGEIVSDGVNGLLVPNHDTTALAEAMDLLYFNKTLRFKITEYARSSVQQFDLDSIGVQYRKIFLNSKVVY